MLTLIDTAIGFVVVLLMISLIIKGTTSVIKNFLDYKRSIVSKQIESFLQRVDQEFTDWNTLFDGLARQGKVHPEAQEPLVLAGLAQASRERQDAATRAAVEIKGEAEPPPSDATPPAKPEPKSAQDLLPVIQAFNDRVGSLVSTTNKNLSMAIGLTICLLFNINCLNVWSTLYHDANLRALFSSSQMVLSVNNGAGQAGGTATPATDSTQLAREVKKEIDALREATPFAFGDIWSKEPSKKAEKKVRFLLYEFFGSLLTGLLASVGAPYLHDMLKILTALRRRVEAGGKTKPGQTEAAEGGAGF